MSEQQQKIPPWAFGLMIAAGAWLANDFIEQRDARTTDAIGRAEGVGETVRRELTLILEPVKTDLQELKADVASNNRSVETQIDAMQSRVGALEANDVRMGGLMERLVAQIEATEARYNEWTSRLSERLNKVEQEN